METYHIIVIGGGGTGAALAHDLSLRGFKVTLLERGELSSGTTGRHHGQLHSGARYAVHDREIAAQCREESFILKSIARDSIEFNYGLFVAVTDGDEAYLEPFLDGCEACGIPTRQLSPGQALKLEPNLNPNLKLAVQVPDGTMDAWRLPLQFFATARHNGADIRTFSEVIGLHTTSGAVTGVQVLDYRRNSDYTLKADLVINAAGAWSASIAGLAGAEAPVSPSPGTMVAVKGRLTNMVISRLHPPGEGDILVPQRNLSIIGTTQWKAEDPDRIVTPGDQVEELLKLAGKMVPVFSKAEIKAAWSAVRPLLEYERNAHRLSRGFSCLDHLESDRLEGLLTVIGGKATVLRAMAEMTADLACRKLGRNIPCATREEKLKPCRAFW